MQAIRFSEMCTDRADLEAIKNVYHSNWYSMGNEVRKLEKEFSKAMGADYAIACNSGETALELAGKSLGLSSGDQVIVPSLTFTATAAAFKKIGCEIEFADIGCLEEPTLTDKSCYKVLGTKTKAVVFVTYGGYAGGLVKVSNFCKELGLSLVIDASHSPCMKVEGKHILEFADVVALSLHSSKNIGCGEGGIVLTNSEVINNRAKVIRSHGIVKFDEPDVNGYDYEIKEIGSNFRMPELSAAIARCQLKKASRINRQRVALSERYDEHLLNTGLQIPFYGKREDGVAHLYCVLLPDGKIRKEIRLLLAKKGIETRVHYPPLHLQPAFYSKHTQWNLVITEDYGSRVLTLPLHCKMDENIVKFITENLCHIIFQ